MKKIVLSNSELQQVLELRENKQSWVKIQEKTGISRRIAKRAYDEWEAKQSQRQLDDARKEVVAQEYSIHLDLLSQMANLLLDSLVIPHPLTDLRGSDEVVSQLLKKDFYQNQPSFELRLGAHQRDKRVVRMNELLLKSLRDHTQRKVAWQALDEWKGARDSCVKYIEEMKEKTHEVLTNILNQKSEPEKNFYQGGKNSSVREKITSVTEKITEGILINIWLSSVMGVESEVTAMKGVSLTKKGTVWVVFHKDAPVETNVTFDHEGPDDNEVLAKEVVEISKWAINNLTKGQVVQIEMLKNEIKTMKDSADKLEAVLNPLVLRPIILNTRCDICPV